jgi:hypothetical protein
MIVEWTKSVSTVATLTRLVTAGVMAEAAISGWRVSPSENYPDLRPSKIEVFEDFYCIGTDLEILAIPFYANFTITIKLASAISTPTPFLLCPSSLPSRIISWHPALLQSVAALFLPQEERGCGRIKDSQRGVPVPP